MAISLHLSELNIGHDNGERMSGMLRKVKFDWLSHRR
jgi:hypothetical protein